MKNIWKTSQPEHLGPDPNFLRFLGMNLERVNAKGSADLSLPDCSILVNRIDYVVEVLMKFEPSLQLKTRTPGNQESFVTKPIFTAKIAMRLLATEGSTFEANFTKIMVVRAQILGFVEGATAKDHANTESLIFRRFHASLQKQEEHINL